MKIKIKPYIWYKFVNSMFTGLSTGAVFIIYGLLQPSIFSVGGLILTVGTLILSRYYARLMKIKMYYSVTLLTEVVILLAMITVLLVPKGEFLALIYYSLFNLVFIFGTYLMRFESSIYKKTKILTAIDSAKQVGNLLGLGASWMFYEAFKLLTPTLSTEPKEAQSWTQVYYFHWLLLAVQVLTLWLCLRAFRQPKDDVKPV